jgi:hypothetical protein
VTADDLHRAAGHMILAALCLERTLDADPDRRADYLSRARDAANAVGALLPLDLRELLSEYL